MTDLVTLGKAAVLATSPLLLGLYLYDRAIKQRLEPHEPAVVATSKSPARSSPTTIPLSPGSFRLLGKSFSISDDDESTVQVARHADWRWSNDDALAEPIAIPIRPETSRLAAPQLAGPYWRWEGFVESLIGAHWEGPGGVWLGSRRVVGSADFGSYLGTIPMLPVWPLRFERLTKDLFSSGDGSNVQPFQESPVITVPPLPANSLAK
jgi:hypothetical protein